ncbi:Outer membrane protein [Methylacidimicrobium sp. AP8]|uniref:efflux transporter outer membrane subunit n=1 Tax=Methylacidimicrobium sp. AP8 TaxID=2730359 RepID=UPI0018C161B5|nr:efflux transporter outer membrane subunit [Methylacidimicrobium sp. AP8]CAB4243963.1 Outer membrane protein [Methylacidimicrobium sp. AP8]
MPPLLLAGCLTPAFERPPVPTAPHYKWAPPAKPVNGPPGPAWKVAEPREHLIGKGDWWKMYRDPELDRLETAALTANPTLAEAFARMIQARAEVLGVKAMFYPTLDFTPWLKSVSNAAQGQWPVPPFPRQLDPWAVVGDTNYEFSLWRQLPQLQAAKEQAKAVQAAFEAIRLSLTSEVAQNYYLLRQIDLELSILDHIIEVFRTDLRLTEERTKLGLGQQLDVQRARSQLEQVEGEREGIRWSRAKVENGLAALTGQSASSFHLRPRPLSGEPPEVPPGLPSDLLERRPDVARAERLMAAANQQIGVARAAFYPSFYLAGFGGFQSLFFNTLLTLHNAYWAAGPLLDVPIFEGGRLIAGLNAAKASYWATVQAYRKEVLAAFQEVEDYLSGIRILAEQQRRFGAAVRASSRQVEMTMDRYRRGLANYFEIVQANKEWLTSQRDDAQTLGKRFVLTALLVKGLGGGWEDASFGPLPPKAAPLGGSAPEPGGAVRTAALGEPAPAPR